MLIIESSVAFITAGFFFLAFELFIKEIFNNS